MSLRVSRLDGQVKLTIPKRIRERDWVDFVNDRADWLRKQVARADRPETVGIGTLLPFEGRAHEVMQGDARGCVIANGTIHVNTRGAVGPKVMAALKARAQERIASATAYYAERAGRDYTKITLRDTRSRWGSCTSDGRLMFSWRLIMAPPEVLDYVVAHEVAHLHEMNHSPRFWAVVEDLYPGYNAQRSWLRQNGSQLHRYQFTSEKP